MDRTVAVDQVVLGVIGLAADAVEALVGVALDVAVVVDGLQELLNGAGVALLGGADEVVVVDVQQVGRLAKPQAVAVGEGLGLDALGLGRLLVLQPVLVGAGDEAHVVAEQAVPAGHGIADDHLVGVADVGRVVDVHDRRRQVVLGHLLRLPTRRSVHIGMNGPPAPSISGRPRFMYIREGQGSGGGLGPQSLSASACGNHAARSSHQVATSDGQVKSGTVGSAAETGTRAGGQTLERGRRSRLRGRDVRRLGRLRRPGLRLRRLRRRLGFVGHLRRHRRAGCLQGSCDCIELVAEPEVNAVGEPRGKVEGVGREGTVRW